MNLSKKSDSRSEWVLLALFGFINFSHIVDFMIMMPLGPQIMRVWNISPKEFSALVSSYTIAAGLSGFISSFYIDRFGKRNTLILLFTGFLLGTLACGLAPGFHIMLLARILTGSCGGVLGGLVMALVGDLIPFERRGKAMGFVSMGFSAATVFGVPIGLMIANRFDMHAPFFALGFSGLFILAAIIFLVPMSTRPIHEVKQSQVQAFVKLLSDSNVRIGLYFGMASLFSQFLIIPFISQSLVANVGYPEDKLQWIYFSGGFVTLFTGPLVGRITDRYGKIETFKVFAILSTIPILIVTHLSPVSMGIVISLCVLMFTISNGRMIPMMSITSAIVEPARRGMFMSLASCLQNISVGLASAVAGIIVTKNDTTLRFDHYGTLGIMSTFVVILSIWLVGRIQLKT